MLAFRIKYSLGLRDIALSFLCYFPDKAKKGGRQKHKEEIFRNAPFFTPASGGLFFRPQVGVIPKGSFQETTFSSLPLCLWRKMYSTSVLFWNQRTISIRYVDTQSYNHMNQGKPGLKSSLAAFLVWIVALKIFMIKKPDASVFSVCMVFYILL